MPPQDPNITHTNNVEDRDELFLRGTRENEDSYDLLILKTREAVLSFDAVEKLAKIPWYAADLLKNTTHVEALSSALHMATSHHALGVEEVMAGEGTKEITLNKFKVAIGHHLHALKLISETKHLRAAANMSSPGGRLLATSSMGAANAAPFKVRRLTVRYGDLSIVSHDCTLHSVLKLRPILLTCKFSMPCS